MNGNELSKKIRFEISKDEESKERVKTILYAFRALNRNVPELKIGFSLFGSLSKGKKIDENNKDRTDIDLCIFFDDETISNFESFKSIYQKIEKLIFGRNEVFDDEYYRFTDPLLRYSKVEILLSLFLDRTIGNKYHLQSFFQKIKTDTILNDPDFFEDICARENVYLITLFGLDIGGGLMRYRKRFIRTLLEFDKIKRERIWKQIIERLKTGERGYGVIPEKVLKQYPEDFEKLCKLLKIDLDK